MGSDRSYYERISVTWLHWAYSWWWQFNSNFGVSAVRNSTHKTARVISVSLSPRNPLRVLHPIRVIYPLPIMRIEKQMRSFRLQQIVTARSLQIHMREPGLFECTISPISMFVLTFDSRHFYTIIYLQWKKWREEKKGTNYVSLTEIRNYANNKRLILLTANEYYLK